MTTTDWDALRNALLKLVGKESEQWRRFNLSTEGIQRGILLRLQELGYLPMKLCLQPDILETRDAVDSLLEEVQRLRGPAELWAMVETLREHEGDTVQIVNDNPDFGGPNCIVGVTGAWTDWVERDIPGDNIRDCLEKAVAAKRHYEGAS